MGPAAPTGELLCLWQAGHPEREGGGSAACLVDGPCSAAPLCTIPEYVSCTTPLLLLLQ
jgi:hypothetical protein